MSPNNKYRDKRDLQLSPSIGQDLKSMPAESNQQDQPAGDNEENFSADKILNILGSHNPFILYIWISMSLVWAIAGMPMMVSAFVMDDLCLENPNVSNAANCSTLNGTISQEFNITHEQSSLIDISTSALLVGLAIGSLILPPLSDRKGRRPILLLCLLGVGMAGLVSSLSPNIYFFIILRLIQGIFLTGCILTNWVLAYESIPQSLRSDTTLVFGIMWMLGYCANAPLAYLSPNWRILIAATSVPSLICFFIFYFVLPESFHFSMLHKPREYIEEWLGIANCWAEFSSTPKIPRELINKIVLNGRPSNRNKNKQKSPGQYKILRKNPELICYIAVFTYLWTCDSLIYYGLSLFSTQLAGDRFWNFTWTGFVELPAYIFSPYFLDKLGRRYFTSLTHLLAAISFLLIIFTPNDSTFALILWLIGKFAIASSFTGLFVYSSELFPTVVRNFCIGICTTISQIGGIVAPTIRILVSISPILPVLFFCICATFASILTLVLPETYDKELPDCVDDIPKHKKSIIKL